MTSSQEQLQWLQQHKAHKQKRTDIMAKENVIRFRHPGYVDNFGQSVLFEIYAFDDNNGSPGLHYRTALTACAIVAGNAWDGYFTTRQGGQEIQHPAGQMLSSPQDYYFHVPANHREPYPIFPSFADWIFPHDALPSDFEITLPTALMLAPRAASSFSVAVAERDKACRLSLYMDCIESAHLVPKEEVEWFRSNEMTRYNRNKKLSGIYTLDDAGNGIALRRDLHFSFDSKSFAIVPKDGKWVAHFFDPTNDYGPEHHNQPIELMEEVSPAFILARLAWTIFPLLDAFMTRGVARVLQYRIKVDGEYSTETKTLSPEQIEQLPTGRGRSVKKTPGSSKRQLLSDQVDVQEKASCTLASASDQASSCQKTARTDSGYAEGEDKSHPSETYQTAPLDRILHSSASPKTGFLPSSNTFDCIYPDTLPFHRRNPIAKKASRHNARLQSLITNSLKAQRPTDPDLLCCDYNQIERDIARDVPPAKKMGGRHICVLCAGAEHWPPMGVDDVVLDFGHGELKGLDDLHPCRTVAEWERRDDAEAWLSDLPDSFEGGVNGVMLDEH